MSGDIDFKAFGDRLQAFVRARWDDLNWQEVELFDDIGVALVIAHNAEDAASDQLHEYLMVQDQLEDDLEQLQEATSNLVAAIEFVYGADLDPDVQQAYEGLYRLVVKAQQ